MAVSLRHPDHAEIVERFDDAIEAMKADGSYAEILSIHRASAW
jgi:polar amino acid transport system substrate-binding protein